MEKIIEYLSKTNEIDNAQLLQLYLQLPTKNKLLGISMTNSEKARDKYLRYDIWKKLPDEVKQSYNQDLTPKAVVAIEPSKDSKPKKLTKKEAFQKFKEAKAKFDSAGDEKAKEKAQEEVTKYANLVAEYYQIGKQEEPPEGDDTGEEEATPEGDDTGKEEATPEGDEKIQLKAKYAREKAVLSNELVKYAPDDNEGRKIIMQQIAAIDEKIKALFETPQTPKKLKLDWLKSDEETASMTSAEIKVYKKSLSDRRGKLNSDIKKGINVAHNEQLIAIIDEAKLKLG